ncbi:hypothetical protein D3C73_1471290 [compost metagenome]
MPQARTLEQQQQRQGNGESDQQGKGVRVGQQAGGTTLILILGGEHREDARQRHAEGHQSTEHHHVHLAADQQGDHEQHQADADFMQVHQGQVQVIGQ